MAKMVFGGLGVVNFFRPGNMFEMRTPSGGMLFFITRLIGSTIRS